MREMMCWKTSVLNIKLCAGCSTTTRTSGRIWDTTSRNITWDILRKHVWMPNLHTILKTFFAQDIKPCINIIWVIYPGIQRISLRSSNNISHNLVCHPHCPRRKIAPHIARRTLMEGAAEVDEQRTWWTHEDDGIGKQPAQTPKLEHTGKRASITHANHSIMTCHIRPYLQQL